MIAPTTSFRVIPRPEPLAEDPDLYAVAIAGNGMAPLLRCGDVAYCRPVKRVTEVSVGMPIHVTFKDGDTIRLLQTCGGGLYELAALKPTGPARRFHPCEVRKLAIVVGACRLWTTPAEVMAEIQRT